MKLHSSIVQANPGIIVKLPLSSKRTNFLVRLKPSEVGFLVPTIAIAFVDENPVSQWRQQLIRLRRFEKAPSEILELCKGFQNEYGIKLAL